MSRSPSVVLHFRDLEIDDVVREAVERRCDRLADEFHEVNRFELTISEKPGFFDGKPGRHWAINGGIYPDVPTFHVEEGELVEVTIRNDTDADHPMHLHGHHVLVLSRDGEPASGSPWWPDTLNLEAGEEYRVAFRADNPGVWMDHCHNLSHAAQGFVMHLAYEGVTTPYELGQETRNRPE